MELLKRIEELKPHNLNCNIFSVYDYNALTIQELLCEFFTKINECVNLCDKTFDLVEYLVNEGISVEVAKKLNQWLDDGTLAELINETIFNDLNKKINNMLQIKLVSDIDGTKYKKGDSVDINYISLLQNQNLSYQLRKLHKTKDVSILFRGDSLTYGYDETSSDNLEPSLDLTDTGLTHKRRRAKINYPHATVELLNKVLNGNITYSNIGYSGSWVQYSFENYYNYRTNNLELIMLGTNDSRLENCPYKGDVKEFIKWYEQLVIREILMGNGLILLTPPQNKGFKDDDIKTFELAVEMIGKKYNVPVLNTSHLLDGYEYTCWSDNTHLTSKGYQIFGYKVATFLLQRNILNPLTINSGNILLTSPMNDNSYHNEEAIYYTASSGYTPDSFDEERVACRLNPNGEITHSFYANEDGLVVLPTMYMYANSSLEIKLLDGVQQAKAKLTTSEYKLSDWDGENKSLISYLSNEDKAYSKINIIKRFNGEVLRINSKGWYTLTLKNTGTEPLNIFGIEFLGCELYENMKNRSYKSTLFSNSDGVEIGEINLIESVTDFDNLIIYYNYSGIGSSILDFNTFTKQDIRVVNLSNTDNVLSKYFSEMELSLVDNNTISITRNKSLQELNGVTQLYDVKNKIVKIVGIKY